jgi:hypothetical protein
MRTVLYQRLAQLEPERFLWVDGVPYPVIAGGADNITLNAGSGGATLATDEAGTPVRHFQYVKLADGTPDSTAVIPGDSTFGLDVDVTRLPADRTVTGTIAAAGQAVEINTDAGEGAASIQLTGTWTGTIEFQGRVNAATWQTIRVWSVGGQQLVTQTTANGAFIINAGPWNAVRAVATAWTTGTATVDAIATRGANTAPSEVAPVDLTDRGTRAVGRVFIRNPSDTTNLGDAAAPLRVDPTGTTTQPVSGTVTVQQATAGNLNATVAQGAAAAQANRWPVFLSDGTAERGTATNPLRVDPTGTTAQPVSGTVTATQGGAWSVTADTELPAAAALADGAANPTTPTVGAALEVFNGTTWDRARGDITNGLDVDVTRVQGSVTVVQATAGNLNATVAQGAPAAQANRWPVFLSDGTAAQGTAANPLRTEPLGTSKTLRRAVVSLTANGDVVAAVAGRRIKVYQYAVQSRNDAMTCQLRDGTTGSFLSLRWGFNAREGAVGGAVDPPAFLFGTSAGNALRAEVTGTGTVDIEVSYWDDDAA